MHHSSARGRRAFSERIQGFQPEELAAALLDRLGTSAHIVTTKRAFLRTLVRRGRVRGSNADDGPAGPAARS